MTKNLRYWPARLLTLLISIHISTQLCNGQTAGQPASDDQLRFFEQKVRPLLIEKCFECHAATAEKIKGGLSLDSRDSILQGGDNGPAAIASQVDASLLIKAVRYDEVGFEMPPSGKLKPHEIEVLEQWVGMGLPYPAAEAAHGKRRTIDIEAGKQHWAFRPLSITQPALIDTAKQVASSQLVTGESTTEAATGANYPWPNRRLDAYILAAQREHQLEPLERATSINLVRRIKFDLLGLPPTDDELATIAADPSREALERQVDRWLASPRYGERWGRWWLELVRYCDVAESWAESQGNSFFYRDWVVQSLNDDMPYDRFAKLQIAADMLPDAKSQDLAALGFIGLSPTYWKELQLPVEIIKTIVADEYEERIHTFSSTFLGLNMACARCHDHKFDPITVQDYYALAGVFASTRAADRALEPGIDSLKVYEAHKQVENRVELVKKLTAEIAKLETAAQPLEGAEPTQAEFAKIEEQAKLLCDKYEQRGHMAALIAQDKAIPGYDLPLAPAVLDGTLEVQPAVGTHGSRIVYEPAPKDAAIDIRGNPNKQADVVPRRFVSVLSKAEPRRFTAGSGRLELAESMFDESPALLARVFVNRVWKQHFTTGLVETPSDFGVQGAAPTHPELLDDLAARFVEQGWSLKWLHREIVLSNCYQQTCRTSVGVSDSHALSWYSGAPLRRLEVEQWRDAMLMSTEFIDWRIGGKPTELAETSHNRRTLYGTIRRRELSDILRLNDVADPLTHSPSRTPTTTPLQQLYTFNSPFMQKISAELAARAEREAPDDVEVQIRMAYRWLYARPATDAEVAVGLQFLSEPSLTAWQEYAQVLLGNNEFLFVD